MLRTIFVKGKIMNFCQDLKKGWLKFDITNVPLSKFNYTVLSALDKHAPK